MVISFSRSSGVVSLALEAFCRCLQTAASWRTSVGCLPLWHSVPVDTVPQPLAGDLLSPSKTRASEAGRAQNIKSFEASLFLLFDRDTKGMLCAQVDPPQAVWDSAGAFEEREHRVFSNGVGLRFHPRAGLFCARCQSIQLHAHSVHSLQNKSEASDRASGNFHLCGSLSPGGPP